jgi:hypothetical protein
MTDQMILTLIEQQRIETALEIGMLVLMLIAIAAGAVFAIQFLRRKRVQRVTTVFCVAALLALACNVVLDHVEAHRQLTIDRAVTKDILALWR